MICLAVVTQIGFDVEVLTRPIKIDNVIRLAARTASGSRLTKPVRKYSTIGAEPAARPAAASIALSVPKNVKGR